MVKKCFLCQNDLSNRSYIISKNKGILKLISSSLQRQDNKHIELESLSTVPVHIHCSVKYNRASDIALSSAKLQLNRQLNKACKKEPQLVEGKRNLLAITNGEVNLDEEQGKVIKKLKIDEYDDDMKNEIIRDAASIIRKDIGLMLYGHLHNRDSIKNFVLDQSNIPESLDVFLSKMFSRKSSSEFPSFEHMSLAHSFISNCLLNISRI